ncbi:MAG: hypothetical protein SchgKO_02530 [Schleiferiaceae bacterium]
MRYIFTVVFLLTFLSGWGQQYVDLVKLGYYNTPVNQFDSLTNGTRIQEYNMDLLLPVVLNDKYTLLLGGYAEGIQAKTDPLQTGLTSVYSTLLKAGVQIKHSDKWTGTYIFLPKIASDFNGPLGSNDFQFGGFVRLKRKLSERKNYSFGLYANSELFGPFFVPLIGFYYTSPDRKFETNITFPLYMDANYELTPWMKGGARFVALVRSYHLHNQNYNPNGEYLTKATNEINAYLSFALTKSVVLETLVGYSIGRNYRIYDIQDRMTWGLSAFRFGDDRDQLNTDFRDGMLLNFKLIYRFHIE